MMNGRRNGGRMPDRTEHILEVNDLTVRRGKDIAVRDASFTIEKGDYVGIVGPNGGGKTTLLHAILGIIPFQNGKIKLFGEDISRFKNWDKIAYVSQEAINFDPQFPLAVRELVGLGRVRRANIGRPLRKADWEAVDDALGFMGISKLAGRRIGQLSGGQKQRVFVAKALVRNPEIMFLDEPVAGVDAGTMERFYKKLSDLNHKRGITILIVSHDLTAVFCRMSKAMCVNRDVHYSEITAEFDPNDLLKKGYGDHFHFVYHEHTCEGVFS
jgi:zinc transport system ATP-binding protein